MTKGERETILDYTRSIGVEAATIRSETVTPYRAAEAARRIEKHLGELATWSITRIRVSKEVAE